MVIPCIFNLCISIKFHTCKGKEPRYL